MQPLKFAAPGSSLVCPALEPPLMTANKLELVLIRKHNRSPFPIELWRRKRQMAWSQWNTRYRVPSSELSLK
ncbi:hypothetical protein TNCV_4234921 [Trichonephila clavipes]|nr:hypothetical protein TNCV_4234921 [Trichonephila clavipes]